MSMTTSHLTSLCASGLRLFVHHYNNKEIVTTTAVTRERLASNNNQCLSAHNNKHKQSWSGLLLRTQHYSSSSSSRSLISPPTSMSVSSLTGCPRWFRVGAAFAPCSQPARPFAAHTTSLMRCT